VKLSLFDVTEPEAPVEIDTKVFRWAPSFVEINGYISTPVRDDHKCFFYSNKKNLLALPVYKQDYQTATASSYGAN